MIYTMPQPDVTYPQVVGNSQTVDITDVLKLHGEDSLHFNVDVTCSSAVGASITLKLQDRASASSDWSDKKTMALVDGLNSMKLMVEVAGDQTYLPLRPQARLVVVCDGSSSIQVDGVRYSRRRGD